MSELLHMTPDASAPAPCSVRFTIDDAIAAGKAWRFNCGPGALCAVLDKTPNEIRPLLGDFESKGYTNPTLMFDILKAQDVKHRLVFRSDNPGPLDTFPTLGLMRVQWGGPWTKPGVPMRVRYRETHWVAVRTMLHPLYPLQIFDINAICVGGWIGWIEWANQLVPWLIKQCSPKASGEWWATHVIEISPHEAGANIRSVQLSLGHAHLETTEGYVHAEADAVPSPLDAL